MMPRPMPDPPASGRLWGVWRGGTPHKQRAERPPLTGGQARGTGTKIQGGDQARGDPPQAVGRTPTACRGSGAGGPPTSREALGVLGGESPCPIPLQAAAFLWIELRELHPAMVWMGSVWGNEFNHASRVQSINPATRSKRSARRLCGSGSEKLHPVVCSMCSGQGNWFHPCISHVPVRS